MDILLNIFQDKRTIEIEQWQNFLKKHSACIEGYKEAYNKTPQEWYNITEQSDWMVWVLKRCPQHIKNKNFWVQIAINCAKEVIHLSKDSQQKPQKAIEAAEQYLLNSFEDNIAVYAFDYTTAYNRACIEAYTRANNLAYAAAHTADAAAYAAAYTAAYAATHTTSSNTAAYIADTAADTLHAAINAATYADGDNSPIKKKLCEMIRKMNPSINIF